MPSPSEIHRAYVDSINSRDWDRLTSLIHPDYSYTGTDGNTMPGGPAAGVAIAKMFVDAIDARIDIVHAHESANTSVIEFNGTGTHIGDFLGVAPTGKPLSAKVCDVIEVRDGLVYREREYFDVLGLMVQLGAIPDPMAAAAH